jgi:acyl phosphate:glycerol-3-phosphate acyltransferase
MNSDATNWMALVPLLVLAGVGYVIGATPFGFLVAKLKGIDIREVGSKNIGATNVWRTLGAAYGLPVFILDTVKGWLPTWGAMVLVADQDTSPALLTGVGMCAGIGAVLGHNFTFWLKGRGGKGVATSAGVLLGLAPVAVGIALVVWVVLFFGFRYSSLASLGAALAVPISMAVMMSGSGSWNWVLLGFGILLCVMTLVRHRSNVARLLAGTELKVGANKHQEETK